MLEALAGQGPAVLVFEDLHWADDALLDFVEHLPAWAVDVPLLVVVAARPEPLATMAVVFYRSVGARLHTVEAEALLPPSA